MAMRFRKWETQLTNGKSCGGKLTRTCGIADALREVIALVPPTDVIRLELITNHNRAEVTDGDKFRSMIAFHLAPTNAMEGAAFKSGDRATAKEKCGQASLTSKQESELSSPVDITDQNPVSVVS